MNSTIKTEDKHVAYIVLETAFLFGNKLNKAEFMQGSTANLKPAPSSYIKQTHKKHPQTSSLSLDTALQIPNFQKCTAFASKGYLQCETEVVNPRKEVEKQ